MHAEIDVVLSHCPHETTAEFRQSGLESLFLDVLDEQAVSCIALASGLLPVSSSTAEIVTIKTIP